MCLAIFAVESLPDWPLIIVANRDEFHERPTASLDVWSDNTCILAGRDLRASGTWLGAHQNGRIALLTNYREPGNNNPDAPSRGKLVESFISGSQTAEQFLDAVNIENQSFNGFNLLLYDGSHAWFMSNRMVNQLNGQLNTLTDNRLNTQHALVPPNALIPLKKGIYGLSNASLNTPWPKVELTRNHVIQHLEKQQEPSMDALFEIFRNQTPASDAELPKTGLPLDRERLLSSPFIIDPLYGTRSTSVILKHRSGIIRFAERSFNQEGSQVGQKIWTIDPVSQSIQYNS